MNEQCPCEQDSTSKKTTLNGASSQGASEIKEPQEPMQEVPNQDQIVQALDQCRQEIQQWKERCMRVTADFDNYKRRLEKEQGSWVRSSKAAVLRNLLPVIDDVERAVADCTKRTRVADNEPLITGIEMMATAFHKFLKTSDVTEITEISIFDPLLHEAIAQVDAPEFESGAIVEVLQKGYMFGDQVLRPAKVSVAK